MSTQADIERVEVLIEKVTKLINETRHYPRSNVYLDIVVLALLSKGIVVSKAVCKLVETGFYEEAFGLTRTLIDIYFTIRYVANRDREERATKFAEFFAKDHEGWANIIGKYYPTTKFSLPVHQGQMLKVAEKFKNPHKWTGLGDQTRKMAMEEDSYELDRNGKPFKCEFDYEVLYKWTSHYVHSTIVAIDTHTVEARDVFIVHSKKKRGDRFRDLSLFNVAAFLSKMLICGFRSLGTEFPIDLSDDFDNVMKSF